MKALEALRQRLERDWANGELRARRLLTPEAWPLELPIGKPSGKAVSEAFEQIKQHLDTWRAVRVGEVVWQPVNYRALAEPALMPISWRLRDADEWLAAIGNTALSKEYRQLRQILAATDPRYHQLLVRQRQQVSARSAEETIRLCALADALTPGCAQGRPLRALPLVGNDSKFFERHRTLLLRLLAVRFGEEALVDGLEAFLGALDSANHWLLVVPLADGLLPFAQLRIRAAELATTPLPAQNILLVENERVWHTLPPLTDTIAVLGAGLDLAWMSAEWLRERRLAYWGDLDTWGLTMLAQARLSQPHLTPLLMDSATFEQAQTHAVVEPEPAPTTPPDGLTEVEQALYRQLLGLERGRLEQEFIPDAKVVKTLNSWHGEVTERERTR